MRKFLLAATVAFPFYSTAQSISDDQLMLNAAEEGMNNIQITNLVDYFHSKDLQQPSQRNAAPVNTLTMGNPGFEQDNFFGWTGYIGDNTVSTYSSLTNVQNGIFSVGDDAALTNSAARHTIVSSVSDTDYYGGFPVVCSGNYSVRLGGQTPNCQSEELEQTFTVDGGTPYIKICYAAVLNSAPSGHTNTQIPYFYYELKDFSGTIFDSLRILANDASLSVSSIPDPSLGNPVNYCSWRTDSISLISYIGQTVTVAVKVAGCTQTGHFGYAYVDFDYPYLNSVSENTALSFSVSPNPATDHLNISGKNISREQVSMINILGQSIEFTATPFENGWQLDLSALNPGVYFIQIREGDKISSEKIIIDGNE
ncbi:MAG TPA: T9SS type A sorting domain-containing protein [Bacteroidia bacterium]|jgi:hypothetical protein|nr:T9SS type A sorting domain-containing protein [Bacteroidia bacterium]